MCLEWQRASQQLRVPGKRKGTVCILPPDGTPYGHSRGGHTGAASPVAIQALPPHHILSKGCTWCWDSSSPSSPFISARCVDSKCGGGHFPRCLFLLQVVAGKCDKPLCVHSPPGWFCELALFPLRLRAPEHRRCSYKLHVEIDGISPGTHVPQYGLEATDRLPFGWCRKSKPCLLSARRDPGRCSFCQCRRGNPRVLARSQFL